MAAKKLPSYVERLGEDGRRYFKAEFKAAVAADILSGKATYAELQAKYALSRSLIASWVESERGTTGNPPKSPMHRGERLPAVSKNGSSLLEKALSTTQVLTPSPEDEMIEQHIELAEAFIDGRISEVGIKFALDKPRDRKFMTTTWLGQVFAGARRCGYRLVKS